MLHLTSNSKEFMLIIKAPAPIDLQAKYEKIYWRHTWLHWSMTQPKGIYHSVVNATSLCWFQNAVLVYSLKNVLSNEDSSNDVVFRSGCTTLKTFLLLLQMMNIHQANAEAKKMSNARLKSRSRGWADSHGAKEHFYLVIAFSKFSASNVKKTQLFLY